MAIKFDSTLMRLIKDVNEIKAALRHVTTNLPLYDVANENTPASISTDQNNYVPGNYDVLRINATADVTITGIANGKKGRFLEIINIGTGRISFTDEDNNSLAINRISTPYDQTVTLLTNARTSFYYDSTQERWTVADLPNIQGQFGRYAIISHDSTTIQTISAFTDTTLQPNNVISDEWGYWDSTNFKFTVPSGESGLYSLHISFYWSSPDIIDWNSYLYVFKNGVTPSDRVAFIANSYVGSTGNIWGITYTGYFSLVSGDSILIKVATGPFSGTPTRDVKIWQTGTHLYIFSKVG